MSNFKAGDKVKIIKKITEGAICWEDYMDSYIDTVLTVDKTHNNLFEVKECKWCFPIECAELVEEAGGGIKYDQNKLKFGLIPAEAEAMVAAVLTIGAIKYAPGNWKKFRDIETRYYDACRRHLNSINSGKDFDPETGLPHSAHAICCLLFILQSEIETKIGKENTKEFIEEKINLFSLNNKKN